MNKFLNEKKKFKKDYIERIKYSGMGVLKILFKI